MEQGNLRQQTLPLVPRHQLALFKEVEAASGEDFLITYITATATASNSQLSLQI